MLNNNLLWGREAVLAAEPRLYGQGIRIAVLDTGVGPHKLLDTARIKSVSMVSGEDATDSHGHGTHCAGIAAGPRQIGIAPEALILSAKVLGRSGSGTWLDIIAGYMWAIANGADIINMSLGSPQRDDFWANVWNAMVKEALDAGILTIAAAGNAGLANVGLPAMAPEILSVGAVDQQLQRTDFSCVGKVDISAPGISILSTVPDDKYAFWGGTSMAAPHVAGVAALYAAETGLRGRELKTKLLESARPLGPTALFGAGLVQYAA